MSSDISALIDSLHSEEKLLVLEYFAGGDPEGFAEAVREARARYERAGGYQPGADLETTPSALEITRGQLKTTRQEYADLVAETAGLRADLETAHEVIKTLSEHQHVMSGQIDLAQQAAECEQGIAQDWQARAEQAETALVRVRDLATRWADLAPADDWGDSMADTAFADAGREVLAALDFPEGTT
ncbi:hypothetical protein HS041_12200 [Planomonospora sp. ID67723]|uniref:hypothetical protein n=1 Tax=Planomonospora sp. ID67723 TaxID=2738134 RepID=UPI0018C36B76|nr:hypothetical protein [Planomonospora sp. ID67723]MBG0828530.1 hypothetical protein [Planomonospora sp. ID67723]